MKAKEYFAQFERDSQELGDKEATVNLIDGFLDEIKGLAKMRKAQSGEAVVSILLELNDKWNALCRLDKQKRFKKDGFILVVRDRVADVIPRILPLLDKTIKERFLLKEVP